MRYRYADAVTEDGVMIVIKEFTEVKKTPKGAWVRERSETYGVFGKKRFVLDGDGRRHCYESKELAWESYKKRKRSQKFNAELALSQANHAIEWIERLGSAPDVEVDTGKPEYWYQYVFD